MNMRADELEDQPEPQTDPTAEENSEKKRLTVTLRKTDRDRLDQIIEDTSMPPNDAVRHALATEAFILRKLREGSKVLVETRDGKTREIEFLF